MRGERRRKKSGEPESLGLIIEKTITGFGLKKKSDQWKVVHAWPSIVGETVARLSRPLYVSNGILFVGTPSSSWAQELDFQKLEILRRISLHVGEGTIRDIRFYGTLQREEKAPAWAENLPELGEEEKRFVRSVVGEIESAPLREMVEKLLNRWFVKKKRF